MQPTTIEKPLPSSVPGVVEDLARRFDDPTVGLRVIPWLRAGRLGRAARMWGLYAAISRAEPATRSARSFAGPRS